LFEKFETFVRKIRNFCSKNSKLLFEKFETFVRKVRNFCSNSTFSICIHIHTYIRFQVCSLSTCFKTSHFQIRTLLKRLEISASENIFRTKFVDAIFGLTQVFFGLFPFAEVP
jgi:hypothetical protein